METHDIVTRIHEYFDAQLNSKMFNKTSDFDFDLKFGEIFEKALALILQYKKLEVKTERDQWVKTGNIAIELHNHNSNKPSGLSVTKADYWATILVDDYRVKSIHILPVSDLKTRVKDIVRNGGGKMVMGGDLKCSELALVPIKEIFGYASNN